MAARRAAAASSEVVESELVIGSATKHPFPLVTGSYSVHTSRATLAQGEAGYAEVARTMKLKPGQLIDA